MKYFSSINKTKLLRAKSIFIWGGSVFTTVNICMNTTLSYWATKDKLQRKPYNERQEIKIDNKIIIREPRKRTKLEEASFIGYSMITAAGISAFTSPIAYLNIPLIPLTYSYINPFNLASFGTICSGHICDLLLEIENYLVHIQNGRIERQETNEQTNEKTNKKKSYENIIEIY